MPQRGRLPLLPLISILAGCTPAAPALVPVGALVGSAAEGRADPVDTTPWTAESGQEDSLFGWSVASAGDVNGDGYADVVVGAPWADARVRQEGFAYLYLGAATGLAGSAAWMVASDRYDAQLGYSVASAGDVNGDGYHDVIVGTPYHTNGESNEGRASVYLGSATGLAASPDWTAESGEGRGELGIAVASAGDVNGDGYDDVVIGAHGHDGGQTNEGAAYVYLGSATGLAPRPAWSAEPDASDAWFGAAVASAGDVNGDGYDDVVVGAHLAENGEADEGRAFVYLGSAAGLSPTPAWTAESDQERAYFGKSVASAGDVDGDGYDDVLVGAYFYDNGDSAEGRAFLYLGSAAGLSSTPAWTQESNEDLGMFGASVASAGDINGDGYADVIVGAPGQTDGETNEGLAHVYLGSAAGLSPSAAWKVAADQVGAAFGTAVASAGDVNGDGVDDVVIGAYDYDHVVEDEGRVFVYHGVQADLGDTADTAETGDTATGGETGDTATGGETADTAPETDTATDTAGDSDETASADPAPSDKPTGCGCASPTGVAPSWFALPLLTLALRRRGRVASPLHTDAPTARPPATLLRATLPSSSSSSPASRSLCLPTGGTTRGCGWVTRRS